MKPAILFDRSRVTCDWECPRKRYWLYEYEGRGIISGDIHREYQMGTVLHTGLADIAKQYQAGAVDIDSIATTAQRQMFETLMAQMAGENAVESQTFALEQAALVEGLLRGFYKHVWPKITAQYPLIMAIEQEMTYEYHGVTFMARPDLVMSDAEGNVWYLEYKSTSSKKEDWVNSWDTAVQLHSSIRAIEATIKEKVTGVVVQGLYKGFKSYGKQSSPFCYSYQKKGNPPFSKDEIQYEYKAGFKRYPTWELEGGVKRWIEGMPEAVLADQFPQTPPIFINDDLVDAFFNQCSVREFIIHRTSEELTITGTDETLLNTTFPQHFDQCRPAWGHACPYRQLCHGRADDPLNQGYSYRVPNHELEVTHQSLAEDGVKDWDDVKVELNANELCEGS